MTPVWRKIFLISVFAVFATVVGWAAPRSNPVLIQKKIQPAELQKAQIRLISHSSREIVIEFECPPYQTYKDSETGEVLEFRIAGAAPLQEPGFPIVPILSQPVDCPPGDVQLQILSREEEILPLPSFRPAGEDQIIDPRYDNLFNVDADPESQGDGQGGLQIEAGTHLWPQRTVELFEGGVFRGHRLMSLRFYPIQTDPPHHTLKWTRHIRVRLLLPDWEGTPEAQNRRFDAPNEQTLLSGILGPLSPAALPTHKIEDRESSILGVQDEFSERFKIIVDEEGVYRVTQEMLASAEVPVNQIDPRTIKLKVRGREIPIFVEGEADGVFDPSDYLEFYGIENRQTYSHFSETFYKDPWSDENVYWFSWNGPYGLRLGEENAEWEPSVGQPVLFLKTTVHFEEDYYYNQLTLGANASLYLTRLAELGPYGVIMDHWFYSSGAGGFETIDIPIYITHPDTQSLASIHQVIVRAALQGITFKGRESPLNAGYHRAILYLNNRTDNGLTIGQISDADDQTAWRNQTSVILETVPDPLGGGITNRDLVHGRNVISLSATGDGLAGGNDMVTLNWVEITYERMLRAFTGGICFEFDTTRGETFEFDIRGFQTSHIEIWKLGKARLTNAEVRWVTPIDEEPSWAVRFLMTPTEAYDMVAFDEAYLKTPAAILPEYSTRDLRSLAGAEYIMLVHESFVEEPSIESLWQRRMATFSGHAEVVTPTEIYEQFNNGILNPEAIRDFLIYAYDHWSIRPTHMCIIGDGNYDVKDRRHYGGSLIPGIYAMTLEYGRGPADGLFGCVSGPPWDIIPDIAVGRISCRTPEELETYVEKIAIYEDDPDYAKAWKSNYVFVADKKDARFNFAQGFCEPVYQKMPDYINTTRVYSDSLLSAQRVGALREAFLQGGVVVNYNGHGGGGLWSGDELMTVSGAKQLLNRRRFPFVTSFTCYSAVYDLRSQGGVLGEAFLFERNAGNNDLIGGIGVYASSGVGWAGTGLSMQGYLFDFIATPPAKTIGEIVQINKTRYYLAAGGESLQLDPLYSMLMVMILLGDPGVRIAIPQAIFEPEINPTIVMPGDTVIVAGTLPFDQNIAQGWYEPYNERKVRLTEAALISEAITSRNFQSPPLVIDSSSNTFEGRYVVYVNNPGTQEDGVGCVSFYARDMIEDATMFLDAESWPSDVISTDSSFYVQVRLFNGNGIDRAYFRGVYSPPEGHGFPAIDTMWMEEVESNLWRTPLAIGPYDITGVTYRVTFTAYDDSGGIDVSSPVTMVLVQPPDIAFSTARSPEILGETYPHLRVPLKKSIRPLSDPVDSVTVSINGYTTPGQTDSFSTSAILTGVDDLSKGFWIDVPIHVKSGNWQFDITIDPDDWIAESDEDNNSSQYSIEPVRHFPVSRGYGTYYENPLEFPVWSRFWEAGASDTLELRIQPRSLLQDSSVLVYAPPRTLTQAEELFAANNMGFYPLPQEYRPHVYTVALSDSSDRLAPGGEVALSFKLEQFVSDTVIYPDTVGALWPSWSPPDTAQEFIFQKRLGSDFWTRLTSWGEVIARDSILIDVDSIGIDSVNFYWQYTWDRLYTLEYSSQTNHLGTFAMLRVDTTSDTLEVPDALPPKIDLAVNGERFVPGAFVPANPQMFFYLSDPSGINRTSGRFYVVLDGDTLPYSDLSWTDTLETSGDQVALIRPHFAIGEHDIVIYATDNIGNDTTYSAGFQVSGDFGIDFALNYPNPFKSETKIVYLLSGQTDEHVKVKIYTVSGRLIRTLQETERAVINYRTLMWDGRDKGGYVVANGVYFGRIIASQNGKRIEKTIKMAKVR